MFPFLYTDITSNLTKTSEKCLTTNPSTSAAVRDQICVPCFTKSDHFPPQLLFQKDLGLAIVTFSVAFLDVTAYHVVGDHSGDFSEVNRRIIFDNY